MPVPGYEVQNVLDISELGTHQYNKGTVSLQPRGGERILSDEASGILYTCRGGFIDIAHVRDNGIWWDSTKRVPDNQLVRHRNFNIGPTLYPWKLVDAQPSATLVAGRKEFDQACQSDWTPLGLSIPVGLGDVPFSQMVTLEIHPGELLVRNGFPFLQPGSTMVTQNDFPAVIAVIARAADAELGAGAGLAAARPGETSRKRE